MDPAQAVLRGIGGIFDEVEHALGDRCAVRTRVELRREIPQRQVELRGEDEHGQSRFEADAAVDQAHAHDDGDERDAERRRELQDRTGEERDTERPHRRPAILLAHLRDSLHLCPSAIEGSERRQPTHDVEEVVREERQCLPAFSRAALRVAADEPHEDRDERKRHQHDPGRNEVDGRNEHQHRDRDDDREDDLRQVARERRLERVDARDGRRGHLRALHPVERGRAAPQPRVSTRSRRSCEMTSAAARRPATSNPQAPSARAMTTSDEQHERALDVAERCAAERRGRRPVRAARPARARAAP